MAAPNADVPAILVGTAGWSLPKDAASQFGEEGTHLQRYATRLPAVEINSSFYRPHRPATYAKWSASVPAAFRFSVKVPKAITHELRLQGATELLTAFLSEASELGDRLGCLLVQLPPSLSFDAAIAETFFRSLREQTAAVAVCEPRHASWFTPAAEKVLVRHGIARVAADPAPVPAAAKPGGHKDTVYCRLHGSPRMYYSDYSTEYLETLAAELLAARRRSRQVWCIFDNTALGAATANALALQSMLAQITGK